LSTDFFFLYRREQVPYQTARPNIYVYCFSFELCVCARLLIWGGVERWDVEIQLKVSVVIVVIVVIIRHNNEKKKSPSQIQEIYQDVSSNQIQSRAMSSTCYHQIENRDDGEENSREKIVILTSRFDRKIRSNQIWNVSTTD